MFDLIFSIPPWLPALILGLPIFWHLLLFLRAREERLALAAHHAFLASHQNMETSREFVLERIMIHPIKSCRGIEVEAAGYTSQGLDHDRTFMIVDMNHKFVTARSHPSMVLISPTVDEARGILRIAFLPGAISSDDPSPPGPIEIPLNPSSVELASWHVWDDVQVWGSTVSVYVVPTTVQNNPHDVISYFLGFPVTLVFKPPHTLPPRALVLPSDNAPEAYALPQALPKDAQCSFADGFPFLIVSSWSANDLQERIARTGHKYARKSNETDEVLDQWINGQAQVLRRTRGNLVVGGKGGKPWAEDTWGVVQIGSDEVVVVSRCGRCQLPNVDPSTSLKHHALPYKALATFRRVDPVYKANACFGVNAVPTASRGIFRVGDKVVVVKKNEWAQREVEQGAEREF